jgi:hypothetical protein
MDRLKRGTPILREGDFMSLLKASAPHGRKAIGRRAFMGRS